MTENFNAKIKEYAELLIKVGVNLQKDQILNIRASVECRDFALICIEEAYKSGARDVIVDWHDDAVDRLRYLNSDGNVFKEFPIWTKEKFEFYRKNNVAVLNIFAEDPESLLGVDSERIMNYSAARGNALKEYYAAQMSNEFQWCIASIPIPAWANKVFPDSENAIDKLWDAIFKSVRVTGNGNAPKLWQEHIKRTAEKAEKLNNFNFKYLEYKSGLGSDFTAELPEEHVWLGGAENTKIGIPFVANMPTEEIFTAPKKDGVNGTIVSSMPLCIDGNVVEGIKFTVKNGKIVKAEAEKGIDVLNNAISLDEGASYFGELALVEYDSPISNMNILFYNTLFDENASCHIAFGEAYPCIKDGDKMTREELCRRGLNYSITHEDFMIGTADMDIVGVGFDGKRVQIMKSGNFVI